VTVTTKWNETYSECYDKATGLLSATTRKQVTPMGELEATTEYSDYKLSTGEAVDHDPRQHHGIDQVIHIDSVSTKPIPDSAFELPEGGSRP
jgi:hypothetical protein